MDYDWINGLLYWIELHDGMIYHLDIETNITVEDKMTDDEITNMAVDPHNG